MEEVIRKLVKNPKFEEAILNKIGSRIDTEEIEKEIEGLEKQHRQLTGAKGWKIPEAHKVPFSSVFWRQGDTGTLLGQRKYR